MPEALRKRQRFTPEDTLPPAEFELASASDAMSAFEQICLSIPASGAVIAVRDAAGLRCVGSLGDAAEVGSHLPPDFGMALECLETGSVVFSDLTDDAQRLLHVGLTMEGVSQVRSAVALPMRAGGSIIGLIAVFSQRESSIQPRDVKALDRIANFWGPLMADEWFPDGIPATIAPDTPVSESVQHEEPPLTETRLQQERNEVTSHQETQEEPASIATVAPDSEPYGVRHSRAPFDAPPTPPSSTAEAHVAPQSVEPPHGMPRFDAAFDAPPIPESSAVAPPVDPTPLKSEVAAAVPELDETPKTPPSISTAEIGALTAASRRFESPVFLAPAESIPPEALHPGEPQRQTWLIVLAVFLIVLLPFWYLKSHSSHTGAIARNSASASNAKSTPTTKPDANSAITSSASPNTSAASAKIPTSTNAPAIESPQISRTPIPDDDMPKPLPDLNTPPPVNNATTTPNTPKPSLPALLGRILKSPNSSPATPQTDSAAPSAPDIASAPQPAPSNDATTNESPAPVNTTPEPAPEPEPAQPINPAATLQPPNFTLAQTLKAHSGWVSSVAFSPNGQLASGSWDRTVKFWDLSTGREVRAAAGKLKQVQALAFTRDGKLLAVEDAGDTITLIDTSTGQPIRELPTDKAVPSVGISWVYSIAFSPDGRWLASAVDDKTVRVWDVTTGTKIRDLTGPRRPVVYAAFSPNGELVATGNDDKSIQIWNVASGAPTITLSGHKKVINAVAFSPDGKVLASASADKTIRVWDILGGKHIRTLSGHQAAVSSISFSPDGRWLASGSWDKTVRIWNVATGKEVQTLRPDARAIYSVTFDPRGRWLAAGSEDGGIEIWQWNAAASNSNPASMDSKATP
jgi:WD40 repeat protein